MNRTSQTITLLDGRTLGFAEYGDPKGKPIFFFHGWPSSRLQPKIVHEAAKKTHVRLISLDRPGYGLSTYKKDRTILDWVGDVTELANYLKIKKFAVDGVSGGGPYAAAVAYKIPQRLTNVAIVVGLGPTWVPGILEGMSLNAKLGWGNYAKYPWLRFLAGLYYYITAKYLPLVFLGGVFLTRSKADKETAYQWMIQSRKNFLVNNKEIFRQGLFGPMLDLYLYTKDWKFNLKDIRAKVYLFYGDADRNVSLAMGKYYHKHIPKSTLTIYANEGHLSAITHVEEIFKTLVS